MIRIFRQGISVLLMFLVGSCALMSAQNVSQVAPSQTENRYHTIQKGETLYSLTKLYRVTAAEICAANPGLSANNFQAGTVILIPLPSQSEKTAEDIEPAQPEVQQGIAGSGCREMHKVKRKETLFSIAKKYGVTLEELQNANPETKAAGYELKRKQILCIPYHIEKPAKPKEVIPTNEELFQQTKGEVKGQSLIRVGVILPLKEKTQTARSALDFYRGLLMAVDSLKKSGLSFEVYTFDSGSTAEDIQKILDRPILSMLDIIFGPVDPTQIKAVSQFSAKNKILMAVPFYSRSVEVTKNPYFFVLNAPDSVQHKEASDLFLNRFSDHSVLIIETGEATNAMVPEIRKHYETVRFAQLPLTESTLLSRLATDRGNVILLSSEDQRSLNVLIPVLREVRQNHPELDIKLFGFPEWQSYTSTSLEDFYKNDTYIFSPFFLNYTTSQYKEFCNAFHQNFKSEMIPGIPRMGIYGFDCGYYFFKGLQKFGKAFAGEGIQSESMQNGFKFRRVSNWGGLLNRKMQLIHYSPSHQTELIEKNDL